MEDFTFYMPLMKSENTSDEDDRLIRGMASCEEMDAQGEVVLQKGMDCSPALKSGFLNWDHMPGPENLIGIPVKIEIADIQNHPIMQKSGLKGVGCYAEGKLLTGHPRADAVWSLLRSLKGTERQLAWSIQGSVLERSGRGNSVLTRSVIRHLAITHQPVQTRSFAEIAKSLTTAIAAPLALENIDAGPMPSREMLYGKCIDSHYSKSGVFKGGLKGALEHLMVCKGKDINQSKDILHTCIIEKIIKL